VCKRETFPILSAKQTNLKVLPFQLSPWPCPPPMGWAHNVLLERCGHHLGSGFPSSIWELTAEAEWRASCLSLAIKVWDCFDSHQTSLPYSYSSYQLEKEEKVAWEATGFWLTDCLSDLLSEAWHYQLTCSPEVLTLSTGPNSSFIKLGLQLSCNLS
jgi:hypothetical protein